VQFKLSSIQLKIKFEIFSWIFSLIICFVVFYESEIRIFKIMMKFEFEFIVNIICSIISKIVISSITVATAYCNWNAEKKSVESINSYRLIFLMCDSEYFSFLSFDQQFSYFAT